MRPAEIRALTAVARAACLLVVLLIAVGCAGGRTAHNANQGTPPPRFVLPSPSPTWPSYLAEDYRAFHKRTLTRSEVAMIHKTLAQLEPCQRPMLRYTFPADGDVQEFALFLQTPTTAWPHVLWTNNLYLHPDTGQVTAAPGPVPPWHGLRYDVAHTPCIE
jgi:anaerobic selenocysteine-containing dehydrogenase